MGWACGRREQCRRVFRRRPHAFRGAGPVAAGLRASPVSSAHFVSLATNGTLRGPHGGIVLARAGFASVIDRAAGGANRDLVGLATKAVVLNEALADSFRAYQWLMLDNAGAMADVLRERGFEAVSGDSGQLVVSDGPPVHVSRSLEQLASAHMFADLCRTYCPDADRSVATGIGVAAAALTARGLTTEESAYVAHVIADVLHAPLQDDIVRRARDEGQELCRQFPVAR
ncbi:hypothetical protein CY652_14010 [Burkholderia sp. WAC0059]|uniref:hypothetical protein n=1 Tax=Burkholderia sp. WAC0059 TaxID=2066022 RepID=UPI000C7F28C6|nr:hypothetical protein [Burkholderia sp. WAC0059]PLZ01881.1 hypothetical protein CY652_14010 [Burkholderia sp. WAC0059]